MEYLQARTLPDIDKVLTGSDKKLVRDRIPEGDPDVWEMSSPATLENRNLRLVAAANKAVEEAEELRERVRQFVACPTEQNKLPIAEEIADLREIIAAVMEEAGVNERLVTQSQTEKANRLGRFSEWIFMSSKRRNIR
jgi:predicted house-cleaning noncanonical NTP pyrophosphatase (MazG superfamily)